MHAVADAEDQCLAVCTPTSLRVYRIIGSTLTCMYFTQLYGIPQDVAAYSYQGSTVQRLIITFDDCKVVIFEYDRFTRSIKLIHTINAEENAFGLGSELNGDKEGRLRHGGVEHNPFLSVDSTHSVACVTVYGHQILLIPLSKQLSSCKPFIIKSLLKLGISGSILDVSFIVGHTMPTLAILHEGDPMPIGHIAKVKAKIHLTIVAIDLYRKCGTAIWSNNTLPHDSFRLVPLSSTRLRGHVLVVSLSCVTLVHQHTCVALAANGFARHTSHKATRVKPSSDKSGYELDASRWVEVADNNSLVVVLKTGALLHLRLILPVEGSITELAFKTEQIASSISASCLCYAADSRLLFLGSRESNAMLLSVDIVPSILDMESIGKTVPNQTPYTTPIAAKKSAQKRLSIGKDDHELEGLCVAEEELLYGEALPLIASAGLSTSTYTISLTVTDTISVLGVALDGRFSHSDEWLDEVDSIDWQGLKKTAYKEPGTHAYIVHREARHALYVVAGLNDQASIYRVSRGLRYSKLSSRNFLGALSICVYDTYLFISFQQRTRVMKYSESPDSALAIQEVLHASSPFVFVDSTVIVGCLDEDVCAQVYTSGIRVFRLSTSEALQDVIVEEDMDMGGFGGKSGEIICMADIKAKWVAALTNARVVYMFEYDAESENLLLKVCCSTSTSCGDASMFTLRYQPVSMSLFFGKFSPKSGPASEVVVTTPLDPIDEIEAYLYGAPLNHSSNGVDMNDHEQPLKHQRINENEPHLHLLVCDVEGVLQIIDISTMMIVFTTSQLSYASNIIPSHGDNSLNDITKKPRLLCNARMEQLDSVDGSSLLCIVGVLDTYDVLIYYAIEENSQIIFFKKYEHCIVTRKRSKLSTPFTFGSEIKTYGSMVLHDYAIHTSTTSNIFVSGPNPVCISMKQGLPSILPISLPELPYANTGTYLVSPITSGNVNGLAVLWQERDDVDGEIKVSKEATIGLYQSIESEDFISPFSSVSLKKVKIGLTSHRCVEILPRSDDVTDQMLLKQKTFVLICSEEVQHQFNPRVLSNEEIEEERSNYDRFFPDLVSCFQPEGEIAPAPPVIDRQYKLVLVQGGAMIDTFELKSCEHVVDVCVLHLQVEQRVSDPYTGQQQPQQYRRSMRVFVVASTSISDKHGEDSQGEGRLLFFTIDYAMFQEEEESALDAIAGTEEGKKEPGESIAGFSSTASSAKSKQAQSSAQAKFFRSIQPKLKLSWEGPGPATVVKQLGEYVLSAVGPILYVYKLNDGVELSQIAFFYGQFYISSVSVIKNFISIADACNSIQLLVWREEDYSLTLLSSDFDEFGVVASAFVLDEGKFAILVADDECNIKLLHYNPT